MWFFFFWLYAVFKKLLNNYLSTEVYDQPNPWNCDIIQLDRVNDLVVYLMLLH